MYSSNNINMIDILANDDVFNRILELQSRKGDRTMKDVDKNVFTKNEWEVLYQTLVEEKDYEEIGKDLDMTRERVRQIMEKVKRKLAYIHSQEEDEDE